MTGRQKRFALVVVGLGGLATAVSLALSAFNDNLVFFLSPSQVVSGEAPVARRIRIGGLVETGSLRRGPDGLTTSFAITDTAHRVEVTYAGPLPDLFKEGHGCVAQGIVSPDGTLQADLILAKHDETYMPLEAARSIEEARRATSTAGRTLNEP